MNFIQFKYNILNVGHFCNLHKSNMSSIIDFSTGLVKFTHHTRTHNITLIVHASTRLDKVKQACGICKKVDFFFISILI
jgi:hypothetical protein